MARYRHNPIVVDAYQFTTNALDEAMAWVRDHLGPRQMLNDVLDETGQPCLAITTPDYEQMRIRVDQWVVYGVGGQLTVYNPDAFAVMFRQVSDDEPDVQPDEAA